jgi:hypothetical protein
MCKPRDCTCGHLFSCSPDHPFRRRFEKTNPMCRKTLTDTGLQRNYRKALCRRDLKLHKKILFGVALPNRATRKTLADIDLGRNLVVCKNVDDMFKRLGI